MGTVLSTDRTHATLTFHFLAVETVLWHYLGLRRKLNRLYLSCFLKYIICIPSSKKSVIVFA